MFLFSLSSPLPAEEITVPTTVSTSAETTPAKKPEDPVFSVLSDAEASTAEADVDSLDPAGHWLARENPLDR